MSTDNSYQYFLLKKIWNYSLFFCSSLESSILLHQESHPVELVAAASFLLKKIQIWISIIWVVAEMCEMCNIQSLLVGYSAQLPNSMVLPLLLSGQHAPEKGNWNPHWLCHPSYIEWCKLLVTSCPSVQGAGRYFCMSVALPSQAWGNHEPIPEAETCI